MSDTKPEPYCPSSESSTSSTVGHRRRREPTRSPLVFSSSPEPEGGSRASRRPSSRALWSSPPPPVTNKKRKIWRGGRMLERMMGRASPRPDSNVDTVSTSESEADPAPSRKRICVEPSLSEVRAVHKHKPRHDRVNINLTRRRFAHERLESTTTRISRTTMSCISVEIARR
jgi:hypothetical protein